MTKRKKSLSNTLIDAAKDLGFDKVTVDKLEALDIPEVKNFTARQIKALRRRENVSQGVFAVYLNVAPSTIQKWERGEVRPQSAALRLLSIIDNKGLNTLYE